MATPKTLPMRAHRDESRGPRLRVDIPAQLRVGATITRIRVRVLNLSIDGFCFECSNTIAPGTRVFLTLPGLSGHEAWIVWRNHFHYGCAFEHSIHASVRDHMAMRYPPAPESPAG